MEAQNDAVNMIFSSKTQANPENTVGLMTMSGKGPTVLVTLTSDLGKILSALHEIKISGNSDFVTGVQIAQLALKHRQNKIQRQRVIAFVGSPLEADDKVLSKLAKKMKKNNVAIDVINFGEESENRAKLEAFVNAVNSGDNSHLITISPGPHILSDMLFSTPVIAGEDGAPAGFAAGGSGGGGGFGYGVDPNMDPELAFALSMSLDEENLRQEAEAAKSKAAEASKASDSGAAEVVSAAAAVASGSDEDDELKAALAMSMEEEVDDGDITMGEGLSEEEQIAKAIAMSMGGSQPTQETPDMNQLSSVLGNLPGVDTDDPRIQSALQGLGDKKQDDEKKKKEKK
jgi:26S proteasome regulatory subunit N10